MEYILNFMDILSPIYIFFFLITKLHGKEINIKIQTYLHQFPKGSKQINIKSIAT